MGSRGFVERVGAELGVRAQHRQIARCGDFGGLPDPGAAYGRQSGAESVLLSAAFTESLYRRSIGFLEAADTPQDANGRTLTLATYPGYMLARSSAFYRIPAWLMPLLILCGFIGTAPARAPPMEWPPQVKLLVILLAAALGWMQVQVTQKEAHGPTRISR